MAQIQFDPSALFDALDQHPEPDLIREMVRFLYQALIDAEATEAVGAEPHERSVTRTTRRNGSRPRTLTPRPVTSVSRSRSSARAASSPQCSSVVAGSTRRCTRW